MSMSDFSHLNIDHTNPLSDPLNLNDHHLVTHLQENANGNDQAGQHSISETIREVAIHAAGAAIGHVIGTAVGAIFHENHDDNDRI